MIFFGTILSSVGQRLFLEICFLGFHVGGSGAPFLKPGDDQMVDFEGLGLTSGSNFYDF